MRLLLWIVLWNVSKSRHPYSLSVSSVQAFVSNSYPPLFHQQKRRDERNIVFPIRQQQRCQNSDHHNDPSSMPLTDTCDQQSSTSSSFVSRRTVVKASCALTASMTAMMTMTGRRQHEARAAPPIAIIAEELGYFPVQNSKGETLYIPKKVQRSSSDQAVALAQFLTQHKVVMAGTYWCPHTQRQKELLGRQAWQYIDYVECSPKGYQGNPRYCINQNIDGYPTWIIPSPKGGPPRLLSGERSLEDLAQQVGFDTFQASLEQDLPPMIGAGSCTLPKKN